MPRRASMRPRPAGRGNSITPIIFSFQGPALPNSSGSQFPNPNPASEPIAAWSTPMLPTSCPIASDPALIYTHQPLANLIES